MHKPFLTINCSENKVDKIRQLTRIFCVLSYEDVTDRELDLLCEFIYNGGVTANAKKSFMMQYETSSANYSQLVKRLFDKKILYNKDHRSGKVLHSDFQKLAEYYVDTDDMNILVIKVNAR